MLTEQLNLEGDAVFKSYALALLPKVIAKVRMNLLEISREIHVQQSLQSQLFAEIDAAIAADTLLTNEAKRKAERTARAAQSEEIKAVNGNLDALSAQQSLAQIELDFYRDEMRVAIALAHCND